MSCGLDELRRAAATGRAAAPERARRAPPRAAPPGRARWSDEEVDGARRELGGERELAGHFAVEVDQDLRVGPGGPRLDPATSTAMHPCLVHVSASVEIRSQAEALHGVAVGDRDEIQPSVARV